MNKAIHILSAIALAMLCAACNSTTSNTPQNNNAQQDDAQCPPSQEPSNNASDDPPPFDPDMCSELIRPRANPVEFVGLTTSWLITPEDFQSFIGPIYGQDAREKRFHQDYPLQDGLLLSVREDPTSADQVIIELDMEVSSTDNPVTRRTIARLPVSYSYGAIFIDTVNAAIARAQEVYQRSPQDAEPFYLEHRLRSVNGGNLDLRVRYQDGLTWLEVQTHTPQTSLLPGQVNQKAFNGEPFESLAGEVNFHLSLDQFEFFSTRAYGITAGAAQNFRDFELNPHNWLRLTVEPELENKLVNVGFEVVTTDGRRLALARAPASVLAGDQFRQNVIRMHNNMTTAMERSGTAPRFEVPFYYDDPSGGGVVQVIARGDNGDFSIAYAVESPVNFLRDTDFVPYQGQIDLPDALEPIEETCEDLGSQAALEGQFLITFAAAPTVANSRNLKAPLRGNVRGSVFKAEDVGGLGPRDGAQSVASFAFEDVDLTDPDNLQTYLLDATLPAGQYQLLGFIDIDANADPDDPDPDRGDPVTVPIGSYPLECAQQPITVEFAILRP